MILDYSSLIMLLEVTHMKLIVFIGIVIICLMIYAVLTLLADNDIAAIITVFIFVYLTYMLLINPNLY